MERGGLRQVIAEKINAMYVDDVRAADVAKGRECNRIALRSEERNSDDVDAVAQFAAALAWCVGRIEQSVQRDDANVMTVGRLFGRERVDDALKTANSRVELTHDVNDTHGHEARWMCVNG